MNIIIRQILLIRLNIYPIFKGIQLFTLGLLLFGCSEQKPADPMCRIKNGEKMTTTASAVCLIRLDNKLISITRTKHDKFELPGGSPRAGESAQCTAHRETWELTGFNVEVGKLLGTNQAGQHYYQCDLAGNFNGELTTFPVPAWSSGKVSSIQLIDPFDIQDDQWRFQNRLIPLRDMFNNID